MFSHKNWKLTHTFLLLKRSYLSLGCQPNLEKIAENVEIFLKIAAKIAQQWKPRKINRNHFIDCFSALSSYFSVNSFKLSPKTRTILDSDTKIQNFRVQISVFFWTTLLSSCRNFVNEIYCKFDLEMREEIFWLFLLNHFD